MVSPQLQSWPSTAMAAVVGNAGPSTHLLDQHKQNRVFAATIALPSCPQCSCHDAAQQCVCAASKQVQLDPVHVDTTRLLEQEDTKCGYAPGRRAPTCWPLNLSKRWFLTASRFDTVTLDLTVSHTTVWAAPFVGCLDAASLV
jgi:hypothetical protein